MPTTTPTTAPPTSARTTAAPTTAATAAAPSAPLLPSLADQAERLVALGVPALAGLGDDELRAAAAALAGRPAADGTAPDDPAPALLVVHPRLAPPSALAPLLRLRERPGFVVVDMTDVDEFSAHGVDVPDAAVYAVEAPDRGDDLANWSPDEAVPALAARGRTAMTLAEGIAWALQTPDVVAPNHCFMTAASRVRTATGRLDARVPALWISGGTGRDGRERRGAPKVGWCWAGNRHTWLGFASTTGRRSAGASG